MLFRFVELDCVYINYFFYSKRIVMLYALAAVLIVLWLLGLITSTTMGGFIHVLLVIAVVAILLRVISGQRVV